MPSPVLPLFRRIAAFFLGISMVSAGCQLDRCYPDIDPRGRYRVDVIELYSPQGSFTYDSGLTIAGAGISPCPAMFDGIAAGATLEFASTGTAPNSVGTCSLVTADVVAAPPDISVIGRSSNKRAQVLAGQGEPLLYAVEDVSLSGCSGAAGFAVYKGNAPDGIFAEPQPGHPPPVLLYRYFSPNSGSCTECNDNFVARLSKE